MKLAKRFWLTFALVAAPRAARAQDAGLAAKVDSAIAATVHNLPASAPGCVVGVSRNGQIAERAFGMADIELAVPLTPQSILESGSVAKQFTAASIVLLAIDGKLGIDEPVRKYIPELPDYGAPLTIRHLLNHTSGIRDWGAVLELTGFGRGARVISQALALDVITHQRGLDFTPGAEYSYSNSGYTLLATIVERVSGQSLPAFTLHRFFTPLGMTHSTWRDDFTRLVPGRAQAYAPNARGGWKLEMPFMNVYGNGGLLTTAGDWLKWNAMLESRSMGGALVDSLERQGVLNDGRRISYALGLEVTTYKGKRQVGHSGSTGGYSTYLTRFPELKLSVAALCNGSNSNPTALALRIVDQIAGPGAAVAPPDSVTLPVAESPKRAPEPRWTPTAAELAAFTGEWYSDEAGASFTFAVEDGVAKLKQRPAASETLVPQGRDHFGRSQRGSTVWFTRDAKGILTMHIGAFRMRDMPFTRVSR